MAWSDPLAGIDVDGPVRIEVFVLCLAAGAIRLSGPCGAGPWYIEKAAGEHPVDVVSRLVADALGEPELVHSTSWRQEADGVVLSFFVVVDPELVASLESAEVVRGTLARSGATAAPATIATGQVLEHASGTWPGWRRTTTSSATGCPRSGGRPWSGYVPEPCRNLG